MDHLEKLRVLIVDDDEAMRRLLRGMLVAFDITDILQADGVVSAIEAMRRSRPDIVLVDWFMEPLDGLELVRTIRRGDHGLDPYTPVIMMTGYAEERRVREARDAGVTEFLGKPIVAEAVMRRLVAVIESPRPFVRTTAYFGPDRRRKQRAISGPERRRKNLGRDEPEPDRGEER